MSPDDRAAFEKAIHGTFAYYRYQPSLAGAIIFTILFSLTTLVHLFQLLRRRTWYFIPLLIGGIFEIVGYIGRAVGSKQTPHWTLGPFIVQSLGLLLAPALFAASIYMILGRIIRLVNGESHSPVRRTWLTKLFVAGDVLSFLTQSAGGALMAGKKADQIKSGQNIIVGGLVIQIIFFGVFIITSTIFHVRIRKAPMMRSADPNVPWIKHMRVLYAASFLIMIRSIVRVIEYVQGNDGAILRREVFLYVFDGCLMLGVLVLYNIIHPSEITASYMQCKSATDRGVDLDMK